jgi:hypothetical protein
MPAGYTTAEFGPYFMRYWTQDQTLIRKASVTSGVITNPQTETFNPSVQWDSLAEDTFDSLGFHTCVCNIVGINDLESASKTIVYPNPSSTEVSIQSALDIASAEVYSILGAMVASQTNTLKSNRMSFKTEDFEEGIYTLKIYYSGGYISSRKLVVKH